MPKKNLFVCRICKKGIVPGHEVTEYGEGYAHRQCSENLALLQRSLPKLKREGK